METQQFNLGGYPGTHGHFFWPYNKELCEELQFSKSLLMKLSYFTPQEVLRNEIDKEKQDYMENKQNMKYRIDDLEARLHSEVSHCSSCTY